MQAFEHEHENFEEKVPGAGVGALALQTGDEKEKEQVAEDRDGRAPQQDGSWGDRAFELTRGERWFSGQRAAFANGLRSPDDEPAAQHSFRKARDPDDPVPG